MSRDPRILSTITNAEQELLKALGADVKRFSVLAKHGGTEQERDDAKEALRNARRQLRQLYAKARSAISLGPRKCKWCEKEFQPTRTWNEFCSPDCRDDWHSYDYAEKRILKELEK